MSRAASLEPQSLRLLVEARFRLQSLADARQLATALASCFPNQPGVALGFLELFVNAVEHGNLGIALDQKAALLKAGTWEAEVERRLATPENRSKRVDVHYRRDAAAATVHVKDEGPGFDWRAFMELDPRRAFEPNGRGIALARQLCFRDMEYLGSGNEIRIVLPLKP
jgi:anti-sigma regulatory factor (Ser/Thr protein kinase)